MKLWQKVFCISLVCVILVTGGTTLLVLLNNFRASVRQETDDGFPSTASSYPPLRTMCCMSGSSATC